MNVKKCKFFSFWQLGLLIIYIWILWVRCQISRWVTTRGERWEFWLLSNEQRESQRGWERWAMRVHCVCVCVVCMKPPDKSCFCCHHLLPSQFLRTAGAYCCILLFSLSLSLSLSPLSLFILCSHHKFLSPSKMLLSSPVCHKKLHFLWGHWKCLAPINKIWLLYGCEESFPTDKNFFKMLYNKGVTQSKCFKRKKPNKIVKRNSLIETVKVKALRTSIKKVSQLLNFIQIIQPPSPVDLYFRMS